MKLRDLFYGIQDFFVNTAFAPLDAIRKLQLDSWFLANLLNWIFMLIAFVAFLYWMKKLSDFNKNNEEDRSVMAHGFLGTSVAKKK